MSRHVDGCTHSSQHGDIVFWRPSKISTAAIGRKLVEVQLQRCQNSFVTYTVDDERAHVGQEHCMLHLAFMYLCN